MAGEMMPQQGPGAGAPAGESPKDGGGADQFTALIENITDGLMMLTDVVGSSGNPAAEKFMALSDQFKSAVEELMAGGQPQEQAGMVDAQAGAGKTVPAGPAGVARG